VVLPSPYTPGSVPLVLAGRDAQLSQVRHELGAVATFGRFAGRIRVETGSRGVGKTSLLKAVQDTAAEAGFVTAWATARADESLAAQLANALVAGLDRIGVAGGRDSRLLQRVRTLELQLGIGPARAGVELDVAGDTATRTPAETALRELVADGAAAARERGSAGVCLLVDELQAAPAADLRTVAYAWQEMGVQPDPPPAALFAAGLPNTPDVLTDAVTFSERFAFRPLQRLTDAEAAYALTATAESAQVGWEPGVVAQVVARAQGYAYFVQLYGDAIWQAAAPEAGGVLGVAHLRQAQEIVAADTAAMFRARWAKASTGEQRLLTAMARFGDRPVRRRDLAEALGVSTTYLSVQRRRLLDKGLIETAGRGRLQFTTPGFAAFIQAETGTGSDV
jgi:hypothetical protein